MKDPLFIQQILTKAKEAGEKVRTEFSALSTGQLNWKSSAESWSIAQCLDHLVVTDGLYSASLQRIAEGNYNMRSWERWSPFSGMFGKLLINRTGENPVIKMKAPKVLKPAESNIDDAIVARFHHHHEKMLGYITAATTVDLDKIKITSPVSKLITYSLRDAITVIVYHKHRHINQAIRVKEMPGFPLN